MRPIFNPAPCERAATSLAAVVGAARKAYPLSIGPRLDEAARQCFTEDSDAGDRLLGALLTLHLPTLNLPPKRTALVAEWLQTKIERYELQPLKSGPEYYADLHKQYRSALEYRWQMCRWWAEQTQYPHLSLPFSDRAALLEKRLLELPTPDAMLFERGMYRTPWPDSPSIPNRLINSPVWDWEGLESAPPDWAARLTCEPYEYSNNRLIRLDIVVAQPPYYFKFGQLAFIEHLRKWAEGGTPNGGETKEVIGARLERLALMQHHLRPLERERPGWGFAEPLTWAAETIATEKQRRKLAQVRNSLTTSEPPPTTGFSLPPQVLFRIDTLARQLGLINGVGQFALSTQHKSALTGFLEALREREVLDPMMTLPELHAFGEARYGIKVNTDRNTKTRETYRKKTLTLLDAVE